MELINAQLIKENIINYLQQFIKYNELSPKLTIIQVEGDEASNRYVSNKKKIGEEIGVKVEHILFPNDITTSQLIGAVEKLNQSDTNGIIVQLPLPEQIDEKMVLSAIDSNKDVDGLTNEQFGKLVAKDPDAFLPCTAQSVMVILESVVDNFEGLDVVIVNRSHLIGLPLTHLLTQKNCTVTLCHSKTKNLYRKIKNADIVITGIGKAHYFNHTDFSDGQIIIDCSMNFIGRKLVGDVDIEDLENMHGYISSGKNQTGPLTCVSLMKNTILSAYKLSGKN